MSEVHDIKKEVKIYYFVFSSLIIMTILTVSASHIHWWRIAFGIAIALIIAIFKGSLVASYFMHLRSEKKMIYIVLSITVSFLICMILLFITSYYDVIYGSKFLNKEQPQMEQQHDSQREHHVP